ncbi:hypothetical protein ACIBKY_51225 [Nonomuraea sp. NPDC050394]|uniref:hypothetical protein n=1 Tax=Nonomuraea sp. NPDC050394 TaxID=3364363 RepID=UPI0037A57521
MAEPLYRLGDVVTVTRTCRIVYIDPKDPARFGAASTEGCANMANVYFRTDDPNTGHQLVASVDWPPVPGDVWRDHNRKRWLAVDIDCPDCEANDRLCTDGYVALNAEFGARYPGNLKLAEAERRYGPFTLELPSPRRDAEQPRGLFNDEPPF